MATLTNGDCFGEIPLLTPTNCSGHYSVVLTILALAILTRRDRAARAWPEAHGLHRGPDLLRGARAPLYHTPLYVAHALLFSHLHYSTTSPRTQAAALEYVRY